jgi:photosystem II stability/assembly factor-like uncharacterized protein
LEGGLHESTDGGTSWSPVQASACPDAFIALAFHPTDGEVLFATACGPFGGSCERGFYTSRDRGRTWALAGQIPPETCTAVGSLEVDRQSGDLLYVHAGGLTYGSLDGGESWSLIEDLWCTALVVDPGEGAVAYCASEEQVLKTADGGQTWEPIASPGWSCPQTMAVSPHDPDVLLVGGKGCYLSTDSGETWEERSGGLGAARSELMLDPAGGATLYVEDASTRWLYRSGDGGQSWTLIDDGGLGLAFDAAGDVLYRLQGEMVARSGDDGATWEPLATVTTVTTGWIETIVAHPIQPRTLYAGSVFFEERWRWRLHASTDGGVSWRSDEFDHNIGRLFFDHQEGVILYAIRGLDAHRSTDGGTTWAPCGETGAFHSLEASGASVDPTDGDRLMVATQGDGVLLTEDGCNNWTQSNEGLGSLYVNSVAIDPRDARRVYAGTQDAGAHVSFDGGRQWGPVNEGLLGALTVYSIAVDPQGKVYAATPYGVFWLEGQ